MSKKIVSLAAALILILFTSGCSEDNINVSTSGQTGNLTLNITGLGDLGASALYEGWIIVGGNPVSTGTFSVNSGGILSQTSFSVSSSNLSSATKFVLTIEPVPDPSSDPSGIKIIAGTFSGNTANLTIGDSSAIANDFMSSAGTYVLATPTNGENSNELSGVWFIDLNGGPHQGLQLPLLPEHWKYEGWVVVPGHSSPLTTGKFIDPNAMDEAAPFSGTMPGPPFPGEDLLNNAPSGYTFPTNLQGGTFVITIEPDPDNSAGPFFLKPLSATAPANALDHINYPMDNIASANNPSGTAVR